MDIEELYTLFLKGGISTDTRNIKAGSVFFALKGENFNANDFAAEAIEKGAAYAVVDERQDSGNYQFILVENVLSCLQQLARFHRRTIEIPLFGLTGSNGKTTTKELIHAVLSKKYRTTATRGNLNNHIGVPLTLLSMTADTEIGIVEMGANHSGEIASLCEIAEPDFGYITNFGKAHLEGFGSLEGVIAAKSELYEHLKNRGKLIFLNYDDPVQKEQQIYPDHYSFGSGADVQVRVRSFLKDSHAALAIDSGEIHSQLTGTYNGPNLAAAYAVGSYFGVSKNSITSALESYVPSNNRSQILQHGSTEIILDAYNANPTSMAAAIENLDQLQKSRKVVILGDMFELGPVSAEEHQKLVDRLEKSSVDIIYLIGEDFYDTRSENDIRKFRTFEDFKKLFDSTELRNSVVLVKGSRGMALERITSLL